MCQKRRIEIQGDQQKRRTKEIEFYRILSKRPTDAPMCVQTDSALRQRLQMFEKDARYVFLKTSASYSLCYVK